MKVHTATLAGGDNNQDRVLVTDNAVIMLDGASAFEPVDVDPGLYAESIGAIIATQLDLHPHTQLSNVVEKAIADTTHKLHLDARQSPSSTVTILRVQHDIVDLYVLGDSPIHYGIDSVRYILNDTRIANLPIAERHHYQAALRSGGGFNELHRANLAALQRAQCHYRNTPTGYWIAETNPAASRHAFVAELDRTASSWFVLATDGVADPIEYFGQPSWQSIACRNSEQLSNLLHLVHDWEGDIDPGGRYLPRAKQHDDKTIAAVSLD